MMKAIITITVALSFLLISCGGKGVASSLFGDSLPNNPYDRYEKVIVHADSLQAHRETFNPSKIFQMPRDEYAAGTQLIVKQVCDCLHDFDYDYASQEDYLARVSISYYRYQMGVDDEVDLAILGYNELLIHYAQMAKNGRLKGHRFPNNYDSIEGILPREIKKKCPEEREKMLDFSSYITAITIDDYFEKKKS